MSLNNTSGSVKSRDTLPAEKFKKESDIPSEKCSSTADSLCDDYHIKQSDLVDSDCKEKRTTMCLRKNKQRLQTDDCDQNQDSRSSEEQNSKESEEQNSKELMAEITKISDPRLSGQIEHDCGETSEHSDGSRDCKCNSSRDGMRRKELNERVSMDNCEDPSSHDSRRTRRSSKRKRDVEDFCPVCGITVRYSELESHYAKEVQNLSKISKNIKKNRFEENNGISTTFVQVKSNRENRHAAKVARFSTRPKNEVHCPVCTILLAGTQDEINNHVLNCINEDELVVVDDDDDSFEEYEFADQTRVRAISFVPGGYRSLQGNSSKPKTPDNDDEDIDIDVDDTLTYGKPQELDVIHTSTDVTEIKEMEQLRQAVLLDPTAQRHVIESRKWSNDSEKNETAETNQSLCGKNTVESKVKGENEDAENCRSDSSNHVVLSLREKIKDLEEQSKNVKCLICLEPYTKPVVSTTCWHVHCEECWLMTMGVKKLCPQCNMIVFPSDLRKIYL